MDTPSLLTSWTFDPLQLAPVAIAAFAYGTRVRTLHRRGTPVSRWRIGLFAVGIALLVLAFASPVAAIGEANVSTSSAIPTAKRPIRQRDTGVPRRPSVRTRVPYAKAAIATGASWSGSNVQLVSSDGGSTGSL